MNFNIDKCYITIKVSGKKPNLFIKNYILNKINYRSYKVIDDKTIILSIKYQDYLTLSKKKTIYKIEIYKYHGVLKLINLIKLNKSLLISLLIACLSLFLISNITFDIEIVHNSKEIRTLVRKSLLKNGIKKYRFIPSFNTRKEIIKKIIDDNKDKIEWLEIEKKGSKIIVKVTERKINNIIEDEIPRNIVAKKDAVIKKIIVSKGEILKEVNDYVKKGDIIVSGNIMKDDEVKQTVSAKGLIYGEVWYTAKISYPLNYVQKVYLDDTRYNLVIKLFNKKIIYKKDYEDINKKNNKLVVKNRLFPLTISIAKQRKVKKINKKYKVDEALDKASYIALKKINTKLDSSEYVISKKNLNYTYNNSKIYLEVFFKVYEDITDYSNIN